MHNPYRRHKQFTLDSQLACAPSFYTKVSVLKRVGSSFHPIPSLPPPRLYPAASKTAVFFFLVIAGVLSGNVRVVEIDGPVVRLELEGACGSCPSSTMTMKMGLERRLVQRIPEISEVVQSIPNGPELSVSLGFLLPLDGFVGRDRCCFEFILLLCRGCFGLVVRGVSLSAEFLLARSSFFNR